MSYYREECFFCGRFKESDYMRTVDLNGDGTNTVSRCDVCFDRDRMMDYLQKIGALVHPVLTSDEGNKIFDGIFETFTETVNNIQIKLFNNTRSFDYEQISDEISDRADSSERQSAFRHPEFPEL